MIRLKARWGLWALYIFGVGVITRLALAAGGRWNSDEAIPVLMANDGHRGWFDMYYWGQDRLGAWPWKFAAWTHAVTHVDWTPDRLRALHIAFALLGGLVFPARLRRAGWPAAVAWTLGCTLLPRAMDIYLSAAQPYGAQTVFILIAIAFLTVEIPSPLQWLGALTFCFLADWESPASAPLLLAASASLFAVRRRWRWRLWARNQFLPILVGGGLEGCLRGIYQGEAKRMFHRSFAGRYSLDGGHLAENISRMLGPFLDHPWVGAMALLALGGTLWVILRPQTEALEAASSEWLVALTGAACANFLVMATTRHVRLNLHNDRYLVPSYLFFFVAAVLAIMTGVLRIRPLAIRAFPACLVLLLVPVFVFTRLPGVDATAHARDVLVALQRQGAQLLIGGYWDVYPITGLDFARKLEARVEEGEYDRNPWSLGLLANSKNTWLIRNRPAPESKSAEASPVWIGFGSVLLAQPSSELRVGETRVIRLEPATDAVPFSGDLPSHLDACPNAHFRLAARVAPGEVWIRTNVEGGHLNLRGRARSGEATLIPAAAHFEGYVRFDVLEALESPELVAQEPSTPCDVFAAAWLPMTTAPASE